VPVGIVAKSLQTKRAKIRKQAGVDLDIEYTVEETTFQSSFRILAGLETQMPQIMSNTDQCTDLTLHVVRVLPYTEQFIIKPVFVVVLLLGPVDSCATPSTRLSREDIADWIAMRCDLLASLAIASSGM
jgi:hypothetical protein